MIYSGGGCVNLIFRQILAESCIKMKEFGPSGDPWVSFGSANDLDFTKSYIQVE